LGRLHADGWGGKGREGDGCEGDTADREDKDSDRTQAILVPFRFLTHGQGRTREKKGEELAQLQSKATGNLIHILRRHSPAVTSLTNALFSF